MHINSFSIVAYFFVSLIVALATFSARCQEQPIPNTQAETTPFTPPEKALDWLQLPDGFSATLFAAEPDLHQPIAASMDHRGRLWVVECFTYSDRKTNYDMSLSDRVVIFEDEDQDGRFDKKTVFWDQGKKLTGIEIGHGGIWLTAAPKFLFLPDRDQDDRPDGPPTVLLDGFEDNTIRHNIVNGLRWGPDGWLYGRHGIQATSFVGVPGSTKSQRIPMNCAIWRYHPVRGKFEVVAEGGTNPWGFDYDEHGEMFMINTVIGHLFHVVPGARYRRMYGSHFNPNTYQVIEQTADHFHWDLGEEHWSVTKKEGMSSGTDAAGGGHAHTGLMIYQGANWPTNYHNTLFTANFHGRRLNNDTIERKGNSYVARHARDFMKTKDPWFRGVEMIYGPDGGVYVLDWSDIGECHENDGIHRTSGRIFKIVFDETFKPVGSVNVSNQIDDQLSSLLSHPNAWYFRQARQRIAERARESDWLLPASLVDTLTSICRDQGNSEVLRLRALWTLYSANFATEEMLLLCSKDENEHLRAWAVRLMCDGLVEISAEFRNRILEMANDDTSGLVRMYIASSLSRFDFSTRSTIASQLCNHSEDANDRVQPHLIWFGIEPALLSNPKAAIKLAAQSKIPLVTENIVRRLTLEIERQPQLVQEILADIDNGILDAESAMRAMALALSGWASAIQPANWTTVSESLRKRDDLSQEVLDDINRLGVVFSDSVAVAELEKLAKSNQTDLAIRRKAIESWAATKPKGLADTLQNLLRDRSITSSVVRAAVHCDEDALAAAIINQIKHMDPEGKVAAIDTLCSRESWALLLLQAIESGKVAKPLVSAFHARQMHDIDSAKLQSRLGEVWGRIRTTPQEIQQRIGDLAEKLIDQDGRFVSFDAAAGRKTYEQNCSRCHVLYGNGGSTGPDLTGSDRQNLNYLLNNVLDPSGSVAESYRASLIRLNDGRFITGLVLGKNDRTIRVQTNEAIVHLDLNSIDEMKTTDKSVMPDGLLNQMNFQQKANLFGYLMSPNQVEIESSNR